MATITVRNLSSELVDRLKALARANNRSMEQEVREILESVAMDRLRACEAIEATWSDQRRPTTAEEVDAWIRQSRP